MRYRWDTVFGGESNLPDAEIVHLHGVSFSIPVVYLC